MGTEASMSSITTSKSARSKALQGWSEESALVRRGDVFAACASDPNQRARHIKQALENGAVGLVIDAQSAAAQVPVLPVIPCSRLGPARGALAADFYASSIPRPLNVLAITGTNGKTLHRLPRGESEQPAGSAVAT